jgi:hypothetical protein
LWKFCADSVISHITSTSSLLFLSTALAFSIFHMLVIDKDCKRNNLILAIDCNVLQHLSEILENNKNFNKLTIMHTNNSDCHWNSEEIFFFRERINNLFKDDSGWSRNILLFFLFICLFISSTSKSHMWDHMCCK